jgi:hypothetical protein
MEYSFDTLCRLLARASRSPSAAKILILGRGDVRGKVIVDDEADDDTDAEKKTDITR